MADRKVSTGGAVGYAVSLLTGNWRAVWGVLALNALTWTVLYAGQATRNAGLILAGLAGALLLGIMLQAAIFRVAFRDRHADDGEFRLGAAGIQWRSTETRMLGAGMLAALGVGFLIFLIALATVAILYGVLAAQGVDAAAALKLPANPADFDPARDWPLLVAQTVVLVAVLYLGIRLMLIMPATADQKALRVFGTWKWTRGQVFPMLLAVVAIQLPFMLLSMLVESATRGDGGAVAAGPAMGVAVVLGAASGLVVAPLSAGLAAYFYRNLAPPSQGSKRP